MGLVCWQGSLDEVVAFDIDRVAAWTTIGVLGSARISGG